jgi:hypothetical protein
LANKLKESKVRDRYLATQKDSEEEILECIWTQAKNISQLHIYTLKTIVKQNIHVQFTEDELTPSFYVTATSSQIRTVHLKETRDWKCHIFSWTKQYDTLLARVRPRNEARISFWSRRSRYVGMGRSEGQESNCPEDNGQSENTSSYITKCETHIDNHVYHCSRRVPDALYCDIAGLRTPSQEADASRRSSGQWFCLAATIETVREQYSFPRVH